MVVNCPTNSLKKKNTTFTEAESVCDVVRQLQCSTSQGKKEVETGKTHKSRELTHKEKHLCRGCVGDITERQNSGHKQKKKKRATVSPCFSFFSAFCVRVCVCVSCMVTKNNNNNNHRYGPLLCQRRVITYKSDSKLCLTFHFACLTSFIVFLFVCLLVDYFVLRILARLASVAPALSTQAVPASSKEKTQKRRSTTTRAQVPQPMSKSQVHREQYSSL